MVISRAPGTDDTPMLKIANRLLESMGFKITSHVEVIYQEGKITINKIENQHDYQLQEPCPIANSTVTDSPGGENAPEGNGHAECRPPNQARNSADVRGVPVYSPFFRGYRGVEKLPSHLRLGGGKMSPIEG